MAARHPNGTPGTLIFWRRPCVARPPPSHPIPSTTSCGTHRNCTGTSGAPPVPGGMLLVRRSCTLPQVAPCPRCRPPPVRALAQGVAAESRMVGASESDTPGPTTARSGVPILPVALHRDSTACVTASVGMSACSDAVRFHIRCRRPASLLQRSQRDQALPDPTRAGGGVLRSHRRG